MFMLNKFYLLKILSPSTVTGHWLTVVCRGQTPRWDGGGGQAALGGIVTLTCLNTERGCSSIFRIIDGIIA